LVRPTSETMFTVTITDRNGCIYEASVLICVTDDPFSRFKAVNVITPNGDGINDALYFSGLELFEDNKLVIYNRWGNIVFEASGYQYRSDRLFDGTRNGERLPADTYYYILNIEGSTFKSALTILWD
jgi:gliding motility-associated-like protein